MNAPVERGTPGNPKVAILSEVDAELALIGTILEHPTAFDVVAETVQRDWITDPGVRMLFDAAMAINRAGNALSSVALLASLPAEANGLSRAEQYQNITRHSVAIGMLPGVIGVLRDRWTRRALTDMAKLTFDAALQVDIDPFAVASSCQEVIDTVSLIKSDNPGVSLGGAMRTLVKNSTANARLNAPTTGLLAVDQKLYGYRPGELYVIAGRPGMGKSIFVCSSLRRTAMAGTGVAIFSLEMTAEEVAARMLSDALDHTEAPGLGDILRGEVTEYGRLAIEAIQPTFDAASMYINDSARLTFAEIAAKARKLKADWTKKGIKLGVICIEHMGLVSPSDRYAGNKVAETSEVSGSARVLAKKLDCCVVLLCQLSREVEKRPDKRPILADLRWSGEIEQDAHVIAFLYREAYYLAMDHDADPEAIRAARNSFEFLVRKNRKGGTGDVHLWCSVAHSSIRDLE